jgi:hypothetical protein
MSNSRPQADKGAVDAFIAFLDEFYMTREDRRTEEVARVFLQGLRSRMAEDMWPAGWSDAEIAARIVRK